MKKLLILFFAMFLLFVPFVVNSGDPHTPKLDERSYDDMREATIRRIPIHSPATTDHNPANPGIALIELFAWLTHDVEYRQNLPSDRIYEKFLQLLAKADCTPVTPVSIITAAGGCQTAIRDIQCCSKSTESEEKRCSEIFTIACSPEKIGNWRQCLAETESRIEPREEKDSDTGQPSSSPTDGGAGASPEGNSSGG